MMFATSIASGHDIMIVSSALNDHPQISTWSIDLDDRNRILRVETSEFIDPMTIVNVLLNYGYSCAEIK